MLKVEPSIPRWMDSAEDMARAISDILSSTGVFGVVDEPCDGLSDRFGKSYIAYPYRVSTGQVFAEITRFADGRHETTRYRILREADMNEVREVFSRFEKRNSPLSMGHWYEVLPE